MRSPVSSRLFLVSVEQVLEGFVLGGVVGDVVLPAVPDDEEPGAGEGGVGAAGVADGGQPGSKAFGRQPVGAVTPRVTAGPRRSHDGRQTRQASRAVTQRHLGCIGNPSKITDQRMVHR
jgi:hypothetical protein